MHRIKVNSDVLERLQEFMRSDLFSTRSGIARSEYWKHEGAKLQTNLKGGGVEISGNSGFYVPRQASALKRATERIAQAVRQPKKAVDWLNRRKASILGGPRLMSPEKAFDAVMTHADVSDADLSRFRINHLKLAKLPKVFASAKAVKKHYQGWSGYQASENILLHYYYQNILRGLVAEDRIKTILEIGSGNGNFASIFHHDWAPVREILVDLPETLAIAIPFLSSLFPDAKFVMPQEAQADGLPERFDFACLTVDQLGVIADDSVDLAINCHSFQEMTHAQIDAYFGLVQRACHDTGLFFTANRVEKIPCDGNAATVEQLAPPNRFAEFPWNPKNEVLVYEVSRLSRLLQLDDMSIRVERIHK